MESSDIARRPQAEPPILKLGGRQMVVMEEGTSVQTTQRQVDMVFVFDTTGSMNDKIEALIRTMSTLVRQVGLLQLDWRMATVPFGDLTVLGDTIVRDLPFVSSVEEAIQQLRNMPRNSGGANEGESSVEAMLAACAKPFRPGAVKVMVLITDEPALGNGQALLSVDQALKTLDAACFTVAPDLAYFRGWAEKRGGEWMEIGRTVDTASILKMFESLVTKVATLADNVHRLGAGSVTAYLERGT